jgi:hypothetical protein
MRPGRARNLTSSNEQRRLARIAVKREMKKHQRARPAPPLCGSETKRFEHWKPLHECRAAPSPEQVPQHPLKPCSQARR